MASTDFEAERSYDDGRFTARTVFRTERAKAVLGYFEPGQFIPVHAPDSDVVIAVHSGTGRVRQGEADRRVESGSVVAVEAGRDRGVIADSGERLEALLVTAPPPTDDEHDPVREGLARGAFEPEVEG